MHSSTARNHPLATLGAFASYPLLRALLHGAMPLKKKEEVCGKPNQYNLNTLEYDWRELPDTHIQVPPPQPCVRDYSALAGYSAAGNRVNPITHQPLPSPGARFGGVSVVSPTPLPSPSRPAQEAMRRAPSPQAHHDNRDHVADLFGDGDGGAGQRPEREPQGRALPPPLVAGESPQALPYPSSGVNGRGDAVHGNAAASPPGPYGADAFNVVWSHEDIKRAVHTNSLEAHRSYLR
ncbi:conserved hypothetical protein [Leishmania infantum JPCM5]|uniref:Uncharacterized protein n=4 Tax=Leishmania donovani species complex TaxID=38574 RepID=A4HWR4_LEIIN|nr:conserved hypothetical protein [Leishmania infantum JPCM5]XP_003859704.1 hypothetical protein, conserved [Leishmania donovani]CAC9474158.1 hypothetical_protein_-_conserved [Leishmania infantum]CAM66894.1 conserved hypothetical protein [Leishmania infantum JPCM5]CBZ32996.1 hypothetical protein, conserved [Leishmania donovani]SUZ40593.1 hypothetical_protein_-_conserved [Leishmania infantum]|eukprot:XP_001464505.1 conserved hypothetical protein [Leishmania infantum JPCM5]